MADPRRNRRRKARARARLAEWRTWPMQLARGPVVRWKRRRHPRVLCETGELAYVIQKGQTLGSTTDTLASLTGFFKGTLGEPWKEPLTAGKWGS